MSTARPVSWALDGLSPYDTKAGQRWTVHHGGRP